MLGSALYYPFVDVRDPQWLRSAILFWDTMQTIVPSSIKNPYHSRDTRICQEEGYLQPLRTELHEGVLEELGKRVVGLIEQPGWLASLIARSARKDPSISLLGRTASRTARQFHTAGIYPEKMSAQLRESLVAHGLAALHRGKISKELGSILKLRAEYDGEWFVVDERFADAYMAALATVLARKARLSPLTTSPDSQGLSLRYLIDDLTGRGSSDSKGALVTLVMEGLRIDPSVKIERLLEFRRSRADQLAELSGVIDQLKSGIEKSDDDDVEAKAKRTYENQIRPALGKLKKELGDNSIGSVWAGFYQAALFSLPSGAAFAHFAQASPRVVATVGMLLTISNVVVNATIARRRVRASSPYTYLLDAQRKFSLPKWAPLSA